MAGGVDASVHVMLDFVDRFELRVYRDQPGRVGAAVIPGGHWLLLSGPHNVVAATLRELADEVDADAARAVA